MNEPAEIAVFLGKKGETTKFYGNGKIVVFEHDGIAWKRTREREFSLQEVHGQIGIRKKMDEIIAFLDSCKVFVGASLTDIPNHFLEKNKFSVWECDGSPDDFLDQVLFREKHSGKKNRYPRYIRKFGAGQVKIILEDKLRTLPERRKKGEED
ncbi:AnfO protein, required for Mo- and V-independent nitrogenase [Dehalobacter sp. UNSWDHB]|uniref:Fe-only nitrogenase accessory AnfO family protein n=1 Tax=unclassified Dehalobacter TaxID=2635733 RepID=UPI00028AED17|nr:MULTISPECIES: Fe-only nitrogenase accessory AnfO family protein [unclassified Dehalobacter]AFV03024.1 Iron only nitrogenase protein AnfO (AnfO_nitrog) [Dehalobacter sp. DCA]AFV06012.1 Iron only nitrogenase protein AnfO (AnfO_nitrog) [Dehalobacter sp. CF]EQB22521.1 AnfO protein, required for Mo- and V-independent nitrogenase [Dehalobacter sp. UNSWDHB]